MTCGSEPVRMRDTFWGVQVPKNSIMIDLLGLLVGCALTAVKIGTSCFFGCFGHPFWDGKIGTSRNQLFCVICSFMHSF